MIEIIPAIDLIDGQNVRLTQGDYQSQEAMGRSPQEAIQFYSQFQAVAGIHIVDLMGALKQGQEEATTIKSLRSYTDLPIQIGGGLRDLATIQAYDRAGIDYFILGTRAIMDLPWLEEVVAAYPGRIFVGIDAKGMDIYINGWTQKSGKTLATYLREIEGLDLKGIIYTDIAKDGMNQGPNVERTAWLQRLTAHPLTASGGVRNQADLKELADQGIGRAIVGKASHVDEFWEGMDVR